MATDSVAYDAPHVAPEDHAETRAHAGSGVIFLWVMWLLTAAWFFPFAISTTAGILEAVAQPSPLPPGYVPTGAGGAQWALLEVGGVILLGVAIAYGLYRYHTRDRALDPAAEAATKDIYDNAQRAREDD